MGKKTPTNISLDKLQQSPEVAGKLAQAFVRYILHQPIKTLLDYEATTKTGIKLFRQLAYDKALADQFRKALKENLEQFRGVKIDGDIASRLPPKATKAALDLVGQQAKLTDRLANELLDHKMIYSLYREVLTSTLMGFTTTVTKLMPGGKMVTGILGMAKDFAQSGLGNTSNLIEAKAKEFVEEALTPGVQLSAKRLADDHFAKEFADWRRHVCQVVLASPAAEIQGMVLETSEKFWAEKIMTIVQDLAAWDQLETVFAAIFQAALEQVGDQTLSEFLDGENSKEVEKLLGDQLATTVQPFFRPRSLSRY